MRLATLHTYPLGLGLQQRCDDPAAPDWCNSAEHGYVADDYVLTAHGLRSNGSTPRLHSGGCGLLSTADDLLKLLHMILSGGRAPDGTRVLGRAAVAGLVHGRRLVGFDWPYGEHGEGSELHADDDVAGARPSAGGGGGGGWSWSSRSELATAPTFGWAGLHAIRFLGSPHERLAAVALAQCHGFDAHCRSRAEELRRGLSDVAHSLLP